MYVAASSIAVPLFPGCSHRPDGDDNALNGSASEEDVDIAARGSERAVRLVIDGTNVIDG